ncbi:hypothetical protein K4K55_004752 [Colletotrichum sp. SAR 10_96]|nr:hypothetical protein K4K55_004752 [Colletotrichum sp. SAR 10_96]
MPLQTRKTIIVRDADSNETIDDMPVTREEYDQEIALRQKIEADLDEKRRILADYDTKLKDAEAALATVRKKWKQAATDLDKMKSSQQRGYHMADSELKDSVTRLRYNISRFAIQYFSGKLPGDTSVANIVDSYEGWKDLSDFIGGRHITAECIRSDRRRPYIIQALIWETIYMDIFGEALWAGGEKVSKAFKDLSKQLQKPANNKGSDSDIEACRRFCFWRAETAAMVVESFNSSKDAKEKSKRGLSKEIDSVRRYTYEHIMPFTRLTKGLGDEVFDILQEAAKLDEAMKRQAVRFDWTFADLREPFDSNTMTLASGETWEADMDGVWVTTCPGLVRQGRSTGDEFGTKTRLLSAEVSWIPSPRAGGSEQKFRRNRTM